MDLADSNPQDDMVVHLCAFSADVMARLEEETGASISTFTIWKQDPKVTMAWAETVEILEALSTSKARLRTFDFLEASATALWNSFMRFLQRLDKRDSTLKDSIGQVPLLVCRMLECCRYGDDISDYGSLKLFQVLIKTAEICSGCTMAEEVTNLLQRAASAMSYHFLSARMALKHEEIEGFWSHYSYLPQSIEYKKPLSLGQYASIHLSAFRAASTSGDKELSERLLLKVADTFEFLKQNRQRVDGFRFLISELYYALAVFTAMYNVPRTDQLTEEATLDELDFSDSFKKLKADIQQVTEKELEGPLELYLRLEIMSRLDCIDPEAFHQTLSRYIESFEPTKDKFKRCLQYVIRLRDQDFNKGMICLRLLYRHIDHFVEDQDWVHQNFVALLRLVPSPCCPNSEALRFLTDLMTNLQELSIAPLSTTESDAALIILRKQIESAYSECSFLEAQAWCRLCKNKIFCNASRTNESIFLRKMMDCSYRAGDYAEVKSTWEQLLLRQARDPTGLHMMYQISLRDAHVESAASFLAVLTQLDQGEHRYALAAVAAAITVSSLIRQKALQSVYEFLKHYVTVLDLKPENVDLHRGLVRLIVYELREDPDDAETLRVQLCEVFDWVRQKNDRKRLDSNDIDWFARCSFTILLEASRTWSATEVIRILNTCIEINDAYHEDAGTMVQIEIQRRQVCCGLIGMLIYASLARKEEDDTEKKLFYHEVLRTCPNFHDSKGSEPSSRKISFAESISPDITEASHEIKCFYLEAALHLERWPEAEEFVHAMSRTEDDKVRAIMADMILTSSLPIDSIIRNLAVLLNFQSSTNANRLLFVRCIFDLCIQHCRSDIRVCELVLDRARIIAQDILFATEEHNFDEEIEHISTVSFNYAVDLHLAGQVPDSERWAYKAIELSENMKNDGGGLTGSLKAKHDQWITYAVDSISEN